MRIFRFVTIYLASLSFIGYFPFFPGTFGTLIALFFSFYLSKVNINVLEYSLILISLIFGGVVICHLGEKYLKQKDPPQIVLDEFIGYLVALFLVPFNIKNIIISLILFRFLDIKKPFFISKLQVVSGGVGILADDLVSGVITNLILQMCQIV